MKLATICAVLLLLISAGCATCPETCAELKTAADAQHCPERVVHETAEVFKPIDLGEIPPAPPLTSEQVTEEAAKADHRLVFDAFAEDLAAARAWGWELYHLLITLAKDHLPNP